MEQVNQQPPGGQQSFPQTNQQEKQLIAILGVQGLSYQNYSVVELQNRSTDYQACPESNLGLCNPLSINFTDF